jgi:(p)ppGpp synthase/HD superfamily hydrolase
MLAAMLMDMDCPNDVIVAALLHDVVEDTSTTLAEIKTEFGDPIADLVQAVTEPDRDAAWEVRKQYTIDKLCAAPLPVKLLACADKLHNLRSMVRDHAEVGEAIWARFKRGKEQQAWYYRGLAASLMAGLEQPEKYPIFEQFQREVADVFGG